MRSRGADRRTRIENVEISCCRTGLALDEAIEYPLRQVITTGCYDGLHLYAPAAVIDCEFWYNGSVWDWMGDYIMAHIGEYLSGTLFEDENVSAYASAAVYVHSDGEAFPEPAVSIERTVMDGTDVGLYIKGATVDPDRPDPNAVVPQVRVVNSCFSLCYFYELYQSEGEADVDVQYSAFAANAYYQTNLDLPYPGCFATGYDPFYTTSDNWRRWI